MRTVKVGGRRYSDPDVISLIEETGDAVDPRSAVLRRAQELNREYRSFESSQVSPLDRLKIMASMRGLKVSQMNIAGLRTESRDAALIPCSSGGSRGQIVYNPQRPSGRIAFSVAHEIAHTFFPNSISGARFRDLCSSESREVNELERLCDLAAAELLMPTEEFRAALRSDFTLTRVDSLAKVFGSSFEATAFRLVTAHPGVAVGGLLRFRMSKADARRVAPSPQSKLFCANTESTNDIPQPKYRRQSFYASPSCSDEHIIRWNKSFDLDSCVYTPQARSGSVMTMREILPNNCSQEGLLEVVRAPYQSEDANPHFPDLIFFWSNPITHTEPKIRVVPDSRQPELELWR